MMHRRTVLVGLLMSPLAVSPLMALSELATTTLTLYGDGIHDDTEALKALFLGKIVNTVAGQYGLEVTDHSLIINNGCFKITEDSFQMYGWPTTKRVLLENIWFNPPEGFVWLWVPAGSYRR